MVIVKDMSRLGRDYLQVGYCGDVTNFKNYSNSFKNKKRLENPEENWTVFKDVHEPIIDRETFDQVQKLIGDYKMFTKYFGNTLDKIGFRLYH